MVEKSQFDNFISRNVTGLVTIKSFKINKFDYKLEFNYSFESVPAEIPVALNP